MDDRILTHFDVSASALTAERARMRVIASNIANVNSTRSAEGGPYKRQVAILETHKVPHSNLEQGVHVKEIITDTSAPRLVYDPEHPDAPMERKARLTHYARLQKTYPYTERLLQHFQFDTVSRVVEDYAANNSIKNITTDLLKD